MLFLHIYKFKKIGLIIKTFKFLVLVFGPNKVKKLLWTLLEYILRNTHPKAYSVAEHICWSQIQGNFSSPSIIDVGANVGKLSYFYLDLFPGAKIYAIEPIKEFFEKIDASGLSKFNLALSNKQKNLTLYQSGGGSKPFKKKIKGKKNGTFKVRAIPGDDFVKEFNIIKVDIIKIDVDGLDFEVLQGFQEVIKNNKPCIQFELSSWWLKVGYTLKQAQTFLEDLDYELFDMTDYGFKELNNELPDCLFITKNIFAKPKGVKLKNFLSL